MKQIAITVGEKSDAIGKPLGDLLDNMAYDLKLPSGVFPVCLYNGKRANDSTIIEAGDMIDICFMRVSIEVF